MADKNHICSRKLADFGNGTGLVYLLTQSTGGRSSFFGSSRNDLHGRMRDESKCKK